METSWVVTPAEYDASFDDVSLHFTTEEMADADLFRREVSIRKALAECLAHSLTAAQHSVCDDIVRSRTFFISIRFDAVTVQVLGLLREFIWTNAPGHRIQMVVYGDIMDGKSLIGACSLYANKVIVEEPLWCKLALELQNAFRTWEAR